MPPIRCLPILLVAFLCWTACVTPPDLAEESAAPPPRELTPYEKALAINQQRLGLQTQAERTAQTAQSPAEATAPQAASTGTPATTIAPLPPDAPQSTPRPTPQPTPQPTPPPIHDTPPRAPADAPWPFPPLESPHGPAPSNWLVENTFSHKFPIEYGNAHATLQKLDDRPMPAQGEPFIDPTTGFRVTRLTDLSLIPDPRYDGKGTPWKGLVMGYSKFSNVNVTGEYFWAFHTNGHRAILYDAKTLRPVYFTTANHWIGSGNDVRWDMSGHPGTEYDVTFIHPNENPHFLARCDGLTGRRYEVLIDFRKATGEDVIIESEEHADASTDGRYRAFSLLRREGGSYKRWQSVIYDMQENKLLPARLNASGLDVSPSGRFVGLSNYKYDRFFQIGDLAQGITDRYTELPSVDNGHDGWGWDYLGNEVYLSQDNRGEQRDPTDPKFRPHHRPDWIFYFNPATEERTNIIHMSELGYPGQHMGRMIRPAAPGWLLLATFNREFETHWAANQIMLIEIKPAAERPKILRVCPNYTAWWPANGGDRKMWYFAEAFASWDPFAQSIYWSCNWYGKYNLEVFRVELPENWAQKAASIQPTP